MKSRRRVNSAVGSSRVLENKSARDLSLGLARGAKLFVIIWLGEKRLKGGPAPRLRVSSKRKTSSALQSGATQQIVGREAR